MLSFFNIENRYVYSIVLVWYQEKSCPSVERLNERNQSYQGSLSILVSSPKFIQCIVVCSYSAA